MRRGLPTTALTLALAWGLVAGCGSSETTPPVVDTYVWDLPASVPPPEVPADNPMSNGKVELGRHLFYDTRLSENQTQSCASCHEQKLAFTDGRARALGSTGEMHPRGSMGLTNIGFTTTLTWANDLIPSLEKQARLPIFGETPVELGMAGKEDLLLQRLRGEPKYEALFAAAFPGSASKDASFSANERIQMDRVLYALASFERSLTSANSPYDRFARGDKSALSESQSRGRDLFFSEKMECFHCHGGFHFADSVSHVGKTIREVFHHNNGLYNLDGKGAYPASDTGLFALSGNPNDMGRFKAPTLRNIGVTAPYMHDGSIATLEGVIEHYARGGRKIDDGPNAGDGSTSPLKSEHVTGFLLSDDEKRDVIAFLNSLTDESFLTNPKFSNPWKDAQ
ncbi:MAG: di-heme enzyme [Polyangiaceae bacterium]|nr:di-heme enzyme [Polyangiaceae bacterium]